MDKERKSLFRVTHTKVNIKMEDLMVSECINGPTPTRLIKGHLKTGLGMEKENGQINIQSI
jgi:hypothetical protein